MLGLAGLSALAGMGSTSCNRRDEYAHIKGGMVNANHHTGHLLRDPSKIPAPSQQEHTDILIAGGGISGLSAGRYLLQQGIADVMMTEVAPTVGGNSIYGKNKDTYYPWAAHYLPIPNNDNTELLSFLHSIGVITSFDPNGLPVYNEYYLCHDPEERLYIKGHWQEGLVPDFSVDEAGKKQIARFFHFVDSLKHAIGNDGKTCFAIPVDMSSADDIYRKLDKISFAEWLQSEGYNSPYLVWYLEYCCKDDYGASLQQTSAWAGLHYFASRKGKAVNANSSTILTWPEGNGFLMKGLYQQSTKNVSTRSLLYDVKIVDNKVHASVYNAATNNSTLIVTDKLLLSTPQYVNKRILKDVDGATAELSGMAAYAPWVVTNITLKGLPASKGAPLSWDNVIYGQPSVGYVVANHQHLHADESITITHYLPLIAETPADARKMAYEKDYPYWRNMVIKELEQAHHGIAKHIMRMDAYVWGHGMIVPQPGYIWSAERQQAMQPVQGKIFFAHSDLSGVSIFEEAFYQGVRAAKQIIGAV